MQRVFVFPGQGSQSIGMGRSFYEASPACKAVFDEVDDALDFHLTRLMFDGDLAELTLTENVQPALMAVSLAAVIFLLEHSGTRHISEWATAVAGHSLGEYSALTTAGALDVRQSAQLLRTRGLAMQKAVPVGQGAMLAVIGLSIDQVNEVAFAVQQQQSDIVCEVANDNADGQIVLSGSAMMIEPATEMAKSMGAKRVLPLPVSAPFHCSLMGYARDVMRDTLKSATIHAPSVPVYANIDTEPTTDPEKIQHNLIDQVCGRVRWRESVLRMSQAGLDCYVETGAGKVLSGLVKRIDKNATVVNIQNVDDVVAFCQD